MQILVKYRLIVVLRVRKIRKLHTAQKTKLPRGVTGWVLDTWSHGCTTLAKHLIVLPACLTDLPLSCMECRKPLHLMSSSCAECNGKTTHHLKGLDKWPSSQWFQLPNTFPDLFLLISTKVIRTAPISSSSLLKPHSWIFGDDDFIFRSLARPCSTNGHLSQMWGTGGASETSKSPCQGKEARKRIHDQLTRFRKPGH